MKSIKTRVHFGTEKIEFICWTIQIAITLYNANKSIKGNQEFRTKTNFFWNKKPKNQKPKLSKVAIANEPLDLLTTIMLRQHQNRLQ